MKISENLLRIEVPTSFPVGNINAYILLGDPLTLIDTGPNLEISFEALKEGAKKEKVKLHDIARIIFTHGHVDHFGLGNKIRHQSGAKTFIHQYDSDYVRFFGKNQKERIEENHDFVMQNGMPESIFGKVFRFSEAIRRVGEPCEIDVMLTDGSEIAGENYSFRVIHSPGHSAGAICLYDEKNRLLFSGDQLLKEITPNPYIRGPFTGLKNFLKSLKKLETIEVKRVFPGHGDCFEDLKGMIHSYYLHHEERKKRILSFLDRPSTPYRISLFLFPDLKVEEHSLALIETISHLELLTEEGRVSSFEENGLFYYTKI